MSATAAAAHGQGGAPPSRHRLALAVLAVVLLLWLAALAVALSASVLPDEASGTVAVVFAPGTSDGDMLAAVLDAGGGLARDTPLRNVWLVYGAEPGFAARLRAGGAWQVFAPVAFEVVALPGCVPGLPAGPTTPAADRSAAAWEI